MSNTAPVGAVFFLGGLFECQAMWYNESGDTMKRHWQLAIVLVGTIGILAQFFNDVFYGELAHPLYAFRTFRYFTILSNLFAVAYFWLMFAKRYEMRHKWFDHLLGGVVVYLFVTFTVYVLLLEGTFEKQLLGEVGNVALHYVNPLLVVGYLVQYRRSYGFERKDITLWLVFPVAYLVFLIGHGLVLDDYLYPFFQVSEVGIQGLLSMIVILFGVFLLLMFALVKIVSRK
jgi:hypothetical protein